MYNSHTIFNEIKYNLMLVLLTLNVRCISESFIEIYKLSQSFIFTLLCGASKSYMKAFKVFTKPFEAP